MSRGRYAVILCSASIYDHESLPHHLPTIARFRTRRAARAEAARLRAENTPGWWISQGYEGEGYYFPVRVLVRRWRRDALDAMSRRYRREDARLMVQCEADARAETLREYLAGRACVHGVPKDNSWGPCGQCNFPEPHDGNGYRVNYIDNPGGSW